MKPSIFRLSRRTYGRAVRPSSRSAFVALLTLLAVATLANPIWGQSPPDAPSRLAAAHFLAQATFGPTGADIDALRDVGFGEWLATQFDLPESPLVDGLDTDGVRAAVYTNMATGRDQLRQRTIFALSQIFVVSANKVGSGPQLTPWMRLLSRNAFGNYRTLLREVTLNPTMGRYLDLAFSRKASSTRAPNENYPREMLQLFSIGLWELNQDGTIKLDGAGRPIPTYTQDTIREFARAMTGWSFTRDDANEVIYTGEMVATQSNHDKGEKRLLNGIVIPPNQLAINDIEMVIDAVFNHANVPPFIATRLIQSLVTSNPSPAFVRRVADVFVDNGRGVRGDLRAVIIAILLDPEALSFASAQDGRLKDPVLHVIGLGRALNATFGDAAKYMYVFNSLGQRVLTPPTVFSFYSPLGTLPGNQELFGPEFQIYPPALAIQRANFIYALLNSQFSLSFQVDLNPFTSVAAHSAALVDLVDERLMFGGMSPELRSIIAAATDAVGTTTTSALKQRALGALYLAAISSEYSVHGINDGPTSGTGLRGVSNAQPPTGLVATSVAGNRLTLRWTAPLLGPAPTGYIVEAGVQPGQTLAAIPTADATPLLVIDAPPGAFYVRVSTVAGASRSRASNEIRVHVNVPATPSAPANLLGMVNGSTVALAWRNTFGGGAPTSLVLDVTGSLNTSLTLPLSDTFTFAGVPAGTYTFSLRAVNGSGTSGPSSPVTLSFPAECTGAPQPPTGLAASRTGIVATVAWDPGASGAAPTSYVLHVGGAASLSLPLGTRTISGTVASGRYTFSVVAVNACGSSAPSTPATLVIP